MLKGIGLSPGTAIGKAYLINCRFAQDDDYLCEGEIQSEVARLAAVLETVKAALRQLVSSAVDKLAEEQIDIFNAHIMIIEDPSLKTKIAAKITAEKKNCSWAIREVFAELEAAFSQMENEYFRERAADIKDIRDQLLAALAGTTDKDELADGSIIVAEELTPSRILELLSKNIAGIATEKGGQTSHVAILASTLGIPLVSKIRGLLDQVCHGTEIILDGHKGLLILQPTVSDKEVYQQPVTLQSQACLNPAVTKDGKKVTIAANISRSGDVPAALAAGAAGVGLFRTEFIYMNKTMPPTEDEQYQLYKQVLSSCGNYAVIIRTLDAGGDKALPYLTEQHQDNPFLGLRGIRLSLTEQKLFKTQIKALLRAAVHGQLKILLPMVTNVEEIIQARKIIAEVYQELAAKGVECSRPLEVGAMIEVPAAALMAQTLIQEADFFSIGTNDLTQYTLAVDRGNADVSDIYDPYHPAVLKLIKMTVDAAKTVSKWTGICGELAGDVHALPLLLGLGIDELSMSPVFVPYIQNRIGQIQVGMIEKTLPELLQCVNGEKVRERLAVLCKQM